MITVTRPWLPDRAKLNHYIDKIYTTGQLTNHGELVKTLEARLAAYLGVRHVVLVANGTSALQVAYKAMGIEGEVITTPFSFVATASSMAWQGLTPRFCDIDANTLTLCPDSVAQCLTPDIQAIVPVHVFGNPCDVERFEHIAQHNKVKLIYDASHCFGVRYKGRSLLSYGHASTLSFHATKLFHSCEGGAVVTDDDNLAEDIRKRINFGITGPAQVDTLGINAKMNELEAAMGLAVLDDIEISMGQREEQVQVYREAFHHLVADNLLVLQRITAHTHENYAYFPVVFNNEATVVAVDQHLKAQGIVTRRYFHPSLDSLAFLNLHNDHCPVSTDVSSRVLCLPLYAGLKVSEQRQIISIINSVVLPDS